MYGDKSEIQAPCKQDACHSSDSTEVLLGAAGLLQSLREIEAGEGAKAEVSAVAQGESRTSSMEADGAGPGVDEGLRQDSEGPSKTSSGVSKVSNDAEGENRSHAAPQKVASHALDPERSEAAREGQCVRVELLRGWDDAHSGLRHAQSGRGGQHG